MENSLLDAHTRFKDYRKDHCWQYEIRLTNRKEDLKEAGLTDSEVAKLRIRDFEFAYVDKTDNRQCKGINVFIERHEWLGDRHPKRPTHRFVAHLRTHNESKSILAGVVIMATPNTFSTLLGPDTKDIEKLIARGACISWSPKNLASWLIMKSISWMVKHTEFRLFTAYSDPEAKELGTIYQACNFFYLGQSSGTVRQYLDPENPHKGWFSDREFRKRSRYFEYAENLGISKEQWNEYMMRETPAWDAMPPRLAACIKVEEERFRQRCFVRFTQPKHKYAYISGRTPTETRRLRRQFIELNPELAQLPYPKIRGK